MDEVSETPFPHGWCRCPQCWEKGTYLRDGVEAINYKNAWMLPCQVCGAEPGKWCVEQASDGSLIECTPHLERKCPLCQDTRLVEKDEAAAWMVRHG